MVVGGDKRSLESVDSSPLLQVRLCVEISNKCTFLRDEWTA